jgi:hypothetical protein
MRVHGPFVVVRLNKEGVRDKCLLRNTGS